MTRDTNDLTELSDVDLEQATGGDWKSCALSISAGALLGAALVPAKHPILGLVALGVGAYAGSQTGWCKGRGSPASSR